MLRLELAIVAILLSCTLGAGQAPNYALSTDRAVDFFQLRNGFHNPPLESRLHCYWWWLNSLATEESITRDLEEMKKKGYSGAILFDAGSPNHPTERKIPTGPVFMSGKWMALFQHAVREADRLEIELSLNVQSGWNPGAPSITPEMALKKLVYSETEVKGGELVQLALPQPETVLVYHDVIVQAIPLTPEDDPVKNDAITDWEIKSLNKRMGWQGIYPLEKLRQGFHDPVNAIIKKDDIIDLTAYFDGKQLRWKAPEGDWLIIRYGWTCTGKKTSRNSIGWEGLSLDHLSPDAFRLFQQTVIDPLVVAAQEAGQSVRYLYTDSWEMDVANWTNQFPEEFKRFRGYELHSYLPVMTGRVVESQEVSNRFLHDFRKTVGDCVAWNHYKLFSDVAHQYGMGIHPESGGPHSAPVDALLVLGISDYPQGEFWARSNTHRVSEGARLVVKQAASAGHTNGKRIIAAEGPTSIGPQWERSPKELKPTIDRIFCSGINRIFWQTFTSSPKEFGIPGNEYFNGTHLNPNVVWWNKAGDFISYINRSCFLLQQGLYVADVLYYYGDDVPNFVFLKEEYSELDFGYDWDKCSKDVILNRVSFNGEKIQLPDGMSYRVMVLAPEKSIDLNVLKKIESLVNAGMTVISPRPEKVSGLTGFPDTDRELKTITDRLWGNINGETVLENKVGKGRVIWGRNINEVLEEMNARPDFSFSSNDKNTKLDYIHRSTNTEDIYFIVNRFAYKGIDDSQYRYQTVMPDRYEQVECTFRVSGKIPQLWDPETSEIKEVLTYREENGRTILPLHLKPEGSVFVIFKNDPPQEHITSILKDGKNFFPHNGFPAAETPYIEIERKGEDNITTISQTGKYNIIWSDGKEHVVEVAGVPPETDLSKGWDLHFDPKWNAPEKIAINELKSWTTFDDPDIKYYSGAARYRKRFFLTQRDIKGRQMILDLGNVQEMASIKINGHQTQLMWSAPFRLDITPFVKAGKNELEVEVMNLWPNRLIGDGKLPESQRLTRTNITKFYASDGDKYLREAGLLGPVKITFANESKLR
jgi:hypothetical protein